MVLSISIHFHVHVAIAAGLLTTIADATWSIVGTHIESRQVGIAIATCVPVNPDPFPSFLESTFAFVAGQGGMALQALLQADSDLADKARSLMANQTDPTDILEAIASEDADGATSFDIPYPNYELRQYGIVDVQERFHTYTGQSLQQLYDDVLMFADTEQMAMAESSWITDRNNVTTSYTYSVQGNVVVPGTVQKAFDAFGAGQDLAENLLLALEAGSANGGDARCSQYFEESGATGMGSKAATIGYIRVVDATGGDVLFITAKEANDGDDAVPLLRQEYDAYKDSNNTVITDAPTIVTTSGAHSISSASTLVFFGGFVVIWGSFL